MVFLTCCIFYCSSKALATPRKKLNDPHGGRGPQVKKIVPQGLP